MPFNLREFTSEINKNGIANPAYFAVMITLPQALLAKFPEANRSLMFRIESASLPTRTVLTHDQRYYGPIRRIPYGFTSLDLTMSVILSEDMREREIFLAWQDLMLGPSRTMKEGTGFESVGIFDAGYYDDAVKGASVQLYTYATSPGVQGAEGPTLLDSLGDIANAAGFDPSVITSPLGFNLSNNNRKVDAALTIELVEPFPIAVNEVPMSWSNGNDYAKLNLVFQYRHTKEVNRYQKPGTSGNSIADFIRSGISAFNRFEPAVSFIRANGASNLFDSFSGQLRPDFPGF